MVGELIVVRLKLKEPGLSKRKRNRSEKRQADQHNESYTVFLDETFASLVKTSTPALSKQLMD
jgi:hypothetical protein